MDIGDAAAQTFPRSQRIIIEETGITGVMPGIFRLVFDEPAEEALERFTYCFWLTQRYVVEAEEPT